MVTKVRNTADRVVAFAADTIFGSDRAYAPALVA